MRPFLFAAAMIGAASVLTTAEAVAQCTSKSIPLPEPTLLTPTPEFSCASKTASPNQATAQSQPGAASSQAGPGAEAAAFDYERQCYRQVKTILRDRLLQLQGSVNEMVKAVNRTCPAAASTARPGQKASIPLPRRALLTPPADINCTYKDSPDGAGGTPAPAQVAAALRMKLDYERQCYRQSEMILRNGVGLLQAAVWEMITALNRDQRSAASAAAKRKPAVAQQPAAMEQPAALQEPAALAQQPNGRNQSRAAAAKEAPCAAFSNGRCVGRDPDPRVRFMLSHDRD